MPILLKHSATYWGAPISYCSYPVSRIMMSPTQPLLLLNNPRGPSILRSGVVLCFFPNPSSRYSRALSQPLALCSSHRPAVPAYTCEPLDVNLGQCHVLLDTASHRPVPPLGRQHHEGQQQRRALSCSLTQQTQCEGLSGTPTATGSPMAYTSAAAPTLTARRTTSLAT
jgi:hypothetical protein